MLSATALNDDTRIVLNDMNLKNVNLNIAVNALIGSMLKHGYVSEVKNFILISVENAGSVKGEALQRRLSDEVSSLLDPYLLGGVGRSAGQSVHAALFCRYCSAAHQRYKPFDHRPEG